MIRKIEQSTQQPQELINEITKNTSNIPKFKITQQIKLKKIAETHAWEVAAIDCGVQRIPWTTPVAQRRPRKRRECSDGSSKIPALAGGGDDGARRKLRRMMVVLDLAGEETTLPHGGAWSSSWRGDLSCTEEWICSI